jgi:hypothetical protein
MTKLVQIKLLHTAVWSFFAGCIMAIPVVGAQAYYLWAPVLIGLVLVEWPCRGSESLPLSVDGPGRKIYRGAIRELRHLPAGVAGYRQQDNLRDAVRRGRIFFVLARWWTS